MSLPDRILAVTDQQKLVPTISCALYRLGSCPQLSDQQLLSLVLLPVPVIALGQFLA